MMKLNDFLRTQEFISKKFICPENESEIDSEKAKLKNSIDDDF